MINNVTLVGRLTKDAELKYTPANQAVAQFVLAVNRTFKNANGAREADFINCVIWRHAAENLANWAKKGALIGITGRIQVRNYENQQGQRVYVTEVIADNFQMLESRSQQQEQQQSQPQQGTAAPQQQQAKQQSSTPNFGRDSDPFSSDSPMDLNSDDLPF